MSDPATAHAMTVDWTRCDGHGVCLELLPEVLQPDDWGYPTVTGDVPAHLVRLAERAVASCPAAALRVRTVAPTGSR